MSDLVSLRELSRRLGVQLRSVQVAIENGRIQVERTEQHGQRTRVFVDYEKAQSQWRDNTDPGKRQRPTRGEMSGKQPAPDAKDPPAPEEAAKGSVYQTARGAKELYNAKMMELKYKLQTKALVPVEDVKKIFFDIGKTIQLNMTNIPNRISAIIAAETDEKKIHDVLSAEISIALEALSNGKIDKLTQ